MPTPTSTALSRTARERGIHLAPDPRFGTGGLLERFVRLPFTQPPDLLERAVTVLADLAPTPLPGTVTAAPSYVA